MISGGLTLGDVTANFKANTVEFERGVKNATQSVSDFQKNTAKSMKNVGDSMMGLGKKSTALLTLPIAGLGALAVKTAADYDKAFATIRAGTGATGAAMDEFKDSFRFVNKSVVNSTEDVATAIANLNTRFGLLGSDLEIAAQDFLDFSRVTGTDVASSIQLVSRLMGDWGVEANMMEQQLDLLTKVSQDTGATIEQLAGDTVTYGVQLRSLGFTQEQAIALLGKFEKEGVATSKVFSGLSIAMATLSERGGDMPTEFNKAIEAIKTAGNDAEATSLAMDLFGRRAGPDLAIAVREGRFEIDDYIESLGDYNGTLFETGQETLTFADEIKLLTKEVQAIIEPFGQDLMEIAKSFIPVLKDLTEKFRDLSPEMRKQITIALGIVAALGPLLMVSGTLIKSLGVIIGLLSIKFVAAGLAVVAIVGGIVLIVDALRKEWEHISPWVEKIIDYFKELFVLIKDLLVPQFILMRKAIEPHIPLLQMLAKVFGVMLVGAVIAIATAVAFAVVGIVTGIRLVIEWFSKWITRVQTAVNEIVKFFMWLYDKLVGNSIIPDLIQGIAGWFAKLPSMIMGALKGVFDAITSPFKKAFESVKNMIPDVSGKIGGLVQGAKGLISGIIPGFADGVRNFSGGLALVGERGPEIVQLPRGANVIPNEASGVVVNMYDTQVGDQQDIQAIGRELGFRVGLIPS